MAIGGVQGAGGQGSAQNNQSNAANKSSTEEFNLEQQKANTQGNAVASGTALTKLKKSRTSKLVNKKKRNRRGAPRTVLVDGEIYEVYLLAIA